MMKNTNNDISSLVSIAQTNEFVRTDENLAKIMQYKNKTFEIFQPIDISWFIIINAMKKPETVIIHVDSKTEYRRFKRYLINNINLRQELIWRKDSANK